MIHFACPQCHSSLKAPAGAAGRQLPCPWCKTAAIVPWVDQAPGAVNDPEAEADPPDEEPAPLQHSRRPEVRQQMAQALTGLGNGEDKSKGPYSIEVSAVKLAWPNLCACCCGPAAAALEIVCGQVSTDRVNAWQVPYCAACLRHVKARHKAREHFRMAGEPLPLWTVYGLGAALIMLLLLIGSAMLSTGSKDATATIAFYLSAAAVALMMGAVAFLGGRENAARAAVRAEARDMLARANLMMGKTCSRCGPAAIYEDAYRTRHRFLFFSLEYTAHFGVANERKMLS